MAHDHFDAPGEEGRNPLEAFFEHLFGGAAGGPPPQRFNKAAERAAFERAKHTALRVAKAFLAPQHQTVQVFGQKMREEFFEPLAKNPLIPIEDTDRLLKELEAKTGRVRESRRPGGPAKDEVWGDTLHDAWYEHLLEHIAYFLWLNLAGHPDEKEGMLEEMLPVLEKYGKVLFHTFRHWDQDGDDSAPGPLAAAATCGVRALRPQLLAKAKELGVGPLA